MKVKPFGMLDIESLGTPDNCGTTHIAMPSFAHVVFHGLDKDPTLLFATLNVQEQLNAGASVTAGTIAFWMEQAKISVSADHIIQALKSAKASLVAFHNGSLYAQREYDTNHELFDQVRSHLNVRDLDGRQIWFGNGPEFDQTIYSAVSLHANPSKQESVPWKFWNLSSARSFKNMYMAAGYSFKELEGDGAVYATNFLQRINSIKYGIYPVPHDPAFDALKEAYCVARIMEVVKLT